MSAGVALLIFAALLTYSKFNFREHSVTTTGTVQNLNPPVVSFRTPGGETITFKQNARPGDWPKRVGEELLVAYMPKNPQRAEVAEFIWVGPQMAGILASFLLIFGYLTFTGRLVGGPLKQQTLRID